MIERHIEIKKWANLKEQIHSIYNNNYYLSPYQSFEFLDIAKLGRLDKHPLATFGFREQNIVLYRDNECIFIAPFYIKKEKPVSIMFMRGEYTAAGHLDFIYSQNLQYEDFKYFVDYLVSHYPKTDIFFDRISERSLTYKYACQYQFEGMGGQRVLTIPMLDTYENWFGSLSKSVRQNLRTSYNRMNKDGLQFEFDLWVDKKPDIKTAKDIQKLYAKRLCEHIKKENKYLEEAVYLIKKNHPMTLGVDRNPSYLAATLYINGTLAAFWSGMLGNDKRVLVPKLAINLDYGRYSPGGVLIDQTFRVFYNSDMNISEFDLQRGEEKYKYSYGGVEYLNYEWHFVTP